MNNRSVYSEIQHGIATLEFFSEDANALNKELLSRLCDEFKKLDKNSDVKAIILKSEKNKTFCAGASLKELVAINDIESGVDFFMGFANLLNTMRTCSKIIIGRIQGKAVGGGVGIIAACDYCFATEQSAIKLSELSIGLAPFVIEPAVTRKVGVGAFAECTFEPTTWKNAYWCKSNGLYARVFESIAEMDREIEYLSTSFEGYNPQALQELKKTLWAGTGHWEALLEERALMSAKLVLSEHCKKAIEKYKN